MTLEIHDALRGNYMMQGLSEMQINEIANLATVKEFSGGDTILRQFAQDNDMMIVLEGTVKITGFSGELIGEAGIGAVLGEMSLIDDKPRSATVVSAGPSKMIAIPNDALTQLMDTDPVIGKTVLLNLGKILTARLRAANVAIDSVVDR